MVVYHGVRMSWEMFETNYGNDSADTPDFRVAKLRMSGGKFSKFWKTPDNRHPTPPIGRWAYFRPAFSIDWLFPRDRVDFA